MSLRETIEEALKMRDTMRANGATAGELEAGFEAIVRSAWPVTRAWKYLCETCRDYGLEMFNCPGDATCGRPKLHMAHEYGRPCWCESGRRFREKPPPDASEFTDAGKTPKKPKQFTRFGR